MQARTFFCNEHLFNCMHITLYEKHSQRKKCFCSVYEAVGELIFIEVLVISISYS